jgi:hypothetical protein
MWTLRSAHLNVGGGTPTGLPGRRGASTMSATTSGGETMDLGLGGKVAVVTGASKRIGLAITTALVAEGVHVVAGSRLR